MFIISSSLFFSYIKYPSFVYPINMKYPDHFIFDPDISINLSIFTLLIIFTILYSKYNIVYLKLIIA